MDAMTLILASIAALEAIVIVLLWRSRNQAWNENASNAGDWIRNVIELDSEIAELREMVNKSRRNTGKAEM